MALQLGVAAVGAGMTYFQGKQMEKAAMEKVNNFKWQEQNNPYKNLQVSTLSSDFQKEEAARAGATAVDAMRGAGARGVAQVGDVVAESNKLNREIAANLDEQQKAIDQMAASDDVRFRDMVEKRQTDELAGYSTLMDTGMDMKYQGINQAVNAIGNFGAYSDMKNAEANNPYLKASATSAPRPGAVATTTGGRVTPGSPSDRLINSKYYQFNY